MYLKAKIGQGELIRDRLSVDTILFSKNIVHFHSHTLHAFAHGEAGVVGERLARMLSTPLPPTKGHPSASVPNQLAEYNASGFRIST